MLNGSSSSCNMDVDNDEIDSKSSTDMRAAAHNIPIPAGIRDTPAGFLNRFGYKLGKTIGKGAYSKVRLVELLKNPEEKLAVKIISRRFAAKDFVGKFLPREIEILQKIKHPFIVRVHRIFEMGHDIYIFMDLAETDLLSYIQGKSSMMAAAEARRYFSHLIDAVHYLHQRNICHRDLKCENILLFPNQVAKLSDFGFAKELLPVGTGIQSKSKTFCGSPAYAAPEILSGTPYDPRPCDVWSLGCILFILLTGNMPFNDNNPIIMLRQQQNRCIKFSQHLDSNNGQMAKHLITQMLEPQVVKRISIADIMKHPWMQIHL